MRKFRFGDPNSRKYKARFWFNLLQFAVVWHVLGKMFLNWRSKELDPEFENKSRVDKMLVLLGKKDSDVNFAHVKLSEKGVTFDFEDVKKNEKTDGDDVGANGGAASEW